MRWIWIDRFTEFESGRRASAIKNVTLAEEHLHQYSKAYPVMPPALIIEGMAQTAGILVGEARGFAEKVILAKIRRVRLDRPVLPGSQLRYEAQIESLDESAAATTGKVYCDGQLIGEIDIVFSHIDRNMGGLEFPEHNFVFTDEFKSLLTIYRRQQQGGTAGDTTS